MWLYILGFLWLLLIVALIRIFRAGGCKLEDEKDIPGSETDINFCERPYIDRYI
jgi:hypothetical protein